jgi:segregation and condensation protein B
MRKKRKQRGRAERAALAAAAAHAGVEIDEAEGEGEGEPEGEPPVGDASEADAGADADADGAADEEPDPGDKLDTGIYMTGDKEAAAIMAAPDDDASDPDVTGERPPAVGERGEGDGDGDDDDLEDDAVADDATAESRPQAAAFDEDTFTSLIEALLFATDKPLTIARLRQLTRVADTGRIQAALERLLREHAERGVVLSNVSGGYSFRTHSRYSPWVQQLIQGRPVRLSRAQLETLALVAYRQPITRPEIDQIRGVDSGATLKLLLERGLIRILGKREEVGRPLLYGTTREFLDFFSLNDLRELPTLREYSELSEESRGVVEKMGMELPPVMPAEPAADHATAEMSPAEVPAEALAPEMPADVVAPDGVDVPDEEPGAEPGAGDSIAEGILGSPDPDSFDDASSDGRPS